MPYQPLITYILIAVTAIISWQAFTNRKLLERLILWPPAVDRSKQYERLITHGFIHADWMHLIFNMLTLYFFGRGMEGYFASIIGRVGFLLFYLSAILVAILPTYMRHQHDANYRSLGASGAVSAVLFSYVLLRPWDMILIYVVPVPAVLFAVVYIGYSIWMDRHGRDNVNHSAHLWGAVYGMLFTIMMDPRVGTDFLQQIANPTFR